MSLSWRNGRIHPNSRSRQRQGSAKAAIIIALVVLIAVVVPLGIYIVANIAFPNGSTGADLSTPDTGTAVHAPSAPAATAAPAPPPVINRATNKIMDLLLIDHDTRQPVPGIRVQSYGRGSQFTGDTADDGRVHIPIPAGRVANQFTVRISGKSYVPKELEWATYQARFEGEVPESCTVEMEHATRVSGRIMGAQGHPIAGAHVYLDFTKKYPDPHEQIDLSPYDRTHEIRSGQDGRWQFDGAPKDCDQIMMAAWDYRFVTGDYWNLQPFTPVSKLYDGTAVFTLHRGFKVEGNVVDPQGVPVVGASVAIGQQRNSSNAIPAQNTDAAGHFSYQFDPGQQVILTIQARGFGPEMLQFPMEAQKKSVTVQLSKPHRISARVVTANGTPVRNAYVGLQSWRGLQTLDANFRTGADGTFVWNQAPADPISVYINARNARGADNVSLKPDQENLIKLLPISHIRGTVTDAQTGKPIEDFRLNFGILWQGNQTVTWQRGWNPGVEISAGRFSFTDNFSYPGIAVRIEKRGYMPAESRIIKPDEGDAALDLKMKPAQDLILTIHAPGGQLVAGATAVIATPGEQAQIINGRDVQFSNAPEQASGPDGRIDFPPQPGPFLIAILADAGYAELNQDAAAKSKDVTLAPWGKVQGRVMVGSKPAAAQNVDLISSQIIRYDPTQPRIFNQLSATTDNDGQFVFDRVSPGSWNISRRVDVTPNSWSNTTLATIDVSPGQTVTANVGGMGRPVVGTVIVPPDLAARSDWTFGFCRMYTHSDYVFPTPQIPEEIRNASPEKQQQWFQAWSKTDAGRAALAAQQKAMAGNRNYSFSVSPDRTFRIDDVLPGTYDITINLRTDNAQNRMGDMLGMGWSRVVVPEMPGGRSDDPLQIPPIPITKMAKYAVGDSIIDVPLRSTDGKDLKFSDFRGKYLLLDVHRMPRTPDLAPIIAVYKRYQNDNRLAMMTLMLDFGQEPKLHGVTWQQASLDLRHMEGQTLFSNFGLQNTTGMPGAWLISPTGKVIAEDLAGDAIQSAVTNALGPPTTQPTTAP